MRKILALGVAVLLLGFCPAYADEEGGSDSGGGVEQGDDPGGEDPPPPPDPAPVAPVDPDPVAPPPPDSEWGAQGGGPVVKPLERVEPTPAMNEPPPPPPPAEAEAPAEPEQHYDRHLAFGVSTLKELGMAAVQIRGRFDHVALEGAFGLAPVLIVVTGDDFGVIAKASLHATASVLIFFNSDQAKLSHGLRLSGIWDDKFSWGGQLGWQGEMRLKSYLSLSFGAGLQVYPWAMDWAEDAIKKKFPGYTAEVDPLQSVVQFYIGVGILFYAL